MDPATVLSTYASAWTLTQRMLEAAQGEDWDVLIELGRERDVLFDQLVQAQPAPPADPQQASELALLIRRLLETEQQIQGLSRAWMDEINGVLSSVQAEKKLLKAYDAF